MTILREACFVGGHWITSPEWIDVDDPATGDIIGKVPSLGVDETRQAISAATAALPAWAALAASERSNALRRLFDLIMARQEDLARLLTREQGKPLAEARSEIAYAASFIEWFAEEAKRSYGDIIPGHRRNARIMVLRQPVGVVAAITPWNFPAAMVTRKIAPALAAGCTVVLKPASQTPFSALALGVLAEQAGIPAGVLNIVTGDPHVICGELTANPAVRKLSFTGSTQVGASLFAQSAPTIKKLSLELGGNAPFIVFNDANLKAAALGAIQSKFRNAGQTCVCVNRIYAQASIYDAFVKELTGLTQKLKVGPGFDTANEIGPLIDDKAAGKVREHLRDAVDRGGRVEVGGDTMVGQPRFFLPTVVSNVPHDALVSREETFGPIAAVIRFETEEQVLDYANASPYGLASYIYTRDLDRAWRVAEGLEAGMVGINTGLISTEVAPFGGIKASGLGREGSRHGLEDYQELKYVCIELNASSDAH